jgi:acetoin utilization deacetylase AcuC-like enzyme
MKIVFHERFFDATYASDPAAAPGRLEGIMKIISTNRDRYEVIRPEPATEADFLRAHSLAHYHEIKNDRALYEVASLAAGGAILAAEEAFRGNPCFAVIRPPGHHASSGSCWGFCFFNNVSVSLLKLFHDKKISSAFVLDFDLHTGDGNIDILQRRSDGFRVSILNPRANTRDAYLAEVEAYLRTLRDVDVFVASAGFDQGIGDWGNLLSPDDYTELGTLMKKYSHFLCNGRRYALLEGGYNHDIIGENVDAFCAGLADGQ